MKRFVKRIKRVCAWIPILWRDEDWDYGYLVKIIQFKLLRMADCIDSNQIIIGHKKVARQMRVVVAHLDRAQDSDKYIPYEFPDFQTEELPDGTLRHTYAEPGQREAVHAKLSEIDAYEDKHWQAAWRKIAEQGRGWWD